MSRTFTQDTAGVVVDYPNATHFAFVPAIVRVTGVASKYDRLDATVSDTATGKTYIEYREPMAGTVLFDLSRYLQMLFANTRHSWIDYRTPFTVSPLQRTARITVSLHARKAVQELLAFDVDAVWGAISTRESSGGVRRRRWFVRYPFTVDLYARCGTEFDVRVDGRRSETVFFCHEPDATNATPYHRYLLNPARAIDPTTLDRTVHIAAPHSLVLENDTERVGLAAWTLDIDRSTNGVYLRWIDRQGRYCYWLFREIGSAAAITAVASWEHGERSLPTAYDEGVNVATGMRQRLRQKSTRTLGAKLVDTETWDFLLSLARSVVVDRFDGYDPEGDPLWHRVSVVPGSYERSVKRLQDFIVSIEEPALSAQTL